ncbi:hypothetical protein VOLCADRAFT_86155 [Volvox carteri f. nagariensis]|uniref:SnoaL-like domain-containing protein n=1 Tax=Volvox carteri f. nagariensis TaxID=3068 RepID=D8TI08_VOLCA|nr:uncharacterized protein VOLCADRAFT_86155 [Volvox carteri f. nagariensis]EFJ52808.1 hypothetical protein VOLCADRAFT_86155 [Volvox carteri f. nagariensis]|eukprot:XP_002945813.1 hypothetical protein VOLCADRAFT_86155 [Volvox carteri f. nagariensis]
MRPKSCTEQPGSNIDRLQHKVKTKKFPGVVPGLRPGRPTRSPGGTRVLAFRDVHRAQQLLETATEFVGYWMLGRQEGPTGRVMEGLTQMAASDVRADIHGLLVHTHEMGIDGLARLLSSEHRPAGLSLKHWHSRVCAANEDTDTVFCLVEMRAEDEEGHPRSCYQVLKLDLLLDDTCRRVTALLERGQWDSAGDDLTPLLLAPMIEREEKEEEAQQEEEEMVRKERKQGGAREQGHGDGHHGHHSQRVRDHATRAGGEVVGSDLPVERIVTQSQVARYTKGLDPEKLRNAARAWCAARSSGTDPRVILEPLLAPEFRLWDAYGLLPLVCSVGDRAAGQQAAAAAAGYAAAAGGPQDTGPSVFGGVSISSSNIGRGGSTATGYTMALMMGGGGCMAPIEAVYDIIESAKNEYDVQVTPVDLAASYTHNVVFNHWVCKMTPKGGHAMTDCSGKPLSIEQECVEVDIFNSDGRMTDAWMFRDALDFEKIMMKARHKDAYMGTESC